MTVCCPHCECQIPSGPKMVYGSVHTSGGIQVRGVIDDRTAEVKASDELMNARYQLRGQNYAILECLECRKEFVIQNWPQKVLCPIPSVTVPSEIPDGVRRALIDAKLAHAIGADTAAVLGARTALFRMQREQKCSRLNDLVEQGKISKLLAGQANEVRLWANLTGHEEMSSDVPSPEDVEQFLRYVDMLFDTIYVQPAKLKALQTKRDGQI